MDDDSSDARAEPAFGPELSWTHRYTAAICCAEQSVPAVRPLADALSRLGFNTRLLTHESPVLALAHRNLALLGPTIYVACMETSVSPDSVEPLQQILSHSRHPNEHLFVGGFDPLAPTALLAPVVRFAESLEQLDEDEAPSPSAAQYFPMAPPEDDDADELPTDVRPVPSLVFRSTQNPLVFEDATAVELDTDELSEFEYDIPTEESVPDTDHHGDFESQPTPSIALTVDDMRPVERESSVPPVAEDPREFATQHFEPEPSQGRTLFYYEAPSESERTPARPIAPQHKPARVRGTARYRAVAVSPVDTDPGPDAGDTLTDSGIATRSVPEPPRGSAEAVRGSSPSPSKRNGTSWLVALGSASAVVGFALFVYFTQRGAQHEASVVVASAAREPAATPNEQTELSAVAPLRRKESAASVVADRNNAASAAPPKSGTAPSSRDAVNRFPAADRSPIADRSPAAGHSPASDSAPTAGRSPASDSAPTAGRSPASDSAPTAGRAPASDSAPAANRSPAAVAPAKAGAFKDDSNPADSDPGKKDRDDAAKGEPESAEPSRTAGEVFHAIDGSPLPEAFSKAVRVRDIVPTERLFVTRPEPSNARISWAQALRQCHEERRGGVSGWRLPHRRELKLLAAIGVLREGTYWSRTRDTTDRRWIYVMDADERNLRITAMEETAALAVCVYPRPKDR